MEAVVERNPKWSYDYREIVSNSPWSSSSFISFFSLLSHKPVAPVEDRVLFSFDPGETTGFAVFLGLNLVIAEQIKTPSIIASTKTLLDYFDRLHPAQVVMESYHVYSWKSKQHTFSTLYTPRLIGAIEFLCALNDVPLKTQTAQQGKGFVTDEKLESWGFYLPGKPHAKDAIRHACQFLLFP